MPAVRLSSRRGSAVGRRRSSLAAIAFAKPGTYGYTPPTSPQAPVTFAPNVTPISYSAPSPTPSPYGSPSLTTDLPLPLFPPSATPAPPPTRRRVPPGKRRSQGYVPRPPNAFMLFRADFVRQKHVPGSIETNHGSLSKIIGNCWRALPLPEKHIWETKAKHAKAEHKLKYPDYKFRPVHNKRGAAPAASTSKEAPSQPTSRSASGTTVKGQLTPQEDERRCEEVAALLLQGKKGEELAWAVRDLDSRRQAELAHSSPSPIPPPYHQNSKFPSPLNLDPMYYPQMASSPPSSSLTSSHASGSATGSPYSLPMPLEHQHDGRDQTWRHRRSSSVPLPNDYSFPPFMYGEGNGMGITLPSIGFPSQGFTLPPPPSSSDDSLAGLPLSISGPGRMSFSWAGTGTGSSFSYPRPSFGFGSGGARGSFSFAGAFGGAWGGNNNGPVGRRASSAQAFFSPSSFPGYSMSAQQHQHQQAEEELPDADTSLFEAGFFNSFGGSAAAPSASSPVSDPVSPFDPAEQQGQIVHAPRPVHAVSPLGVEFEQQQQQQQAAQGYEHAHAHEQTQHYAHDSYAPDADANAQYASDHSTPTSAYGDAGVSTPLYPESPVVEGEVQQQQQQHAGEQTQDYPPFEFPSDEFASELHLRSDSMDMGAPAASGYDIEMSAYENYASESYASEFV
ncbi:hypothetical protein B0H13DRAFT_2316530 [Mycena leptocephala]|nr:hypothetical protein B0H13DRAFT_2316530 [Mycena leptocephala]